MTTFFKIINPCEPYNAGTLIVGIGVSIYYLWQYRKKHSEQLLTSLPGIWTSIGIFCTFMAICISLYNINNLETTSNIGQTVSQIQNASNNIDIKKIIERLIPAFSTSMWGLFFAFVSTILMRVHFSGLEQKQNNALKERTPEEYIMDIANILPNIENIGLKQQANLVDLITNLNTVISNQESQNSYIRNIISNQKTQIEFNEVLKSNIASQSEIMEKFVNDFVRHMDEVFTNIKNTTEAQITSFSREQFEKVAALMSDINDKFTASTSAIINEQQSTAQLMLVSTNERLSEITTSLSNLATGLSSTASIAIEEFNSKHLENMQNIVNSNEQLTTALMSQQTEKMQDIVNNQQQLTTALMSQQTEKMQDIVNNQQQLSTDLMSQQKENMHELINNQVELSSMLMSQQKADYEEIMKGQQSFNNQMQESHQNFSNTLQQKLEEGYNAITQHNVDSLQQMQNLQEAYTELCNHILQDSTNSSKEISEQIRENFQQTTESISSNLTTQINRLSQDISQYLGSLKESYEYINDHIALIKSNYEQAAMSYSAAVENTHVQNENFDNALTSFNTSMLQVNDTNNNIANILEILETRQENMEKLISDIHDMSSAINTLQSLEAHLNKLTAVK